MEKKLHVLQQTVRRQKKKIHTLKDLVEQKLVSDAEQHLLEQNFDGVGKHLFENQIANAKQASKQAIRYNEHTKQFALTLHYYSPRAYDFVHQVLLLPHPSRIQSWAASVDCEPGFLCEEMQHKTIQF